MKISFVEIEKGNIVPNEETMYDIEVEEDHSYNIENVIVHNSACTTAPNTGFGTRNWQLSSVKDVASAFRLDPEEYGIPGVDYDTQPHNNVAVIADGGIRNYGDVAKSIAFGADFVMVGGFMGGHDENPGILIEDADGNQFKEFFGSASENQKGDSKHVEGKRLLVPYKGSINHTLDAIKDNLQSSVSYAGGKELLDLRDTRYVLLNR